MHFLKRNKTAFVSVFLLILALWLVFFALKGFASQAADNTSLPAREIPELSGGTWQKEKGGYAYVLSDEAKTRATGWAKIGTKVYYFDENGYRVTGVKKVSGAYHYFNKSGVQKTGWKKANGKRYYFDPNKNGRRAVGWTLIGKYTYYFRSSGKYRTGWATIKGKTYYFLTNGHMAKGWRTISGKRYYFNKKTGERTTGEITIKNKTYNFDDNGVMVQLGFDGDGYFYDASGRRLQKSTIKKLLKVALQPVGSTMYVWGGGWNVTDTNSESSDIVARTIGVSPRWKAFYQQQTADYDYTTTRYQTKDGLDCSGYVGWCMYNIFNTTNGNPGYVMLAQVMARTYASYGWGSYTPASGVKDFKAGDIMSTSAGHVYIVVGQCNDGSVVLLHSSPKGVMITGTTTRSGSKKSEAITLAKKYMKKYYPQWYAKYPEVSRGSSYLTNYQQMRWYIGTKNTVMSDPEGYRNMTAAQVLKNLFG